MSPKLIILEFLLKYGPAFAREVVAILKKEPVTDQDWENLFAKATKSYDSYIEDAAKRASGT